MASKNKQKNQNTKNQTKAETKETKETQKKVEESTNQTKEAKGETPEVKAIRFTVNAALRLEELIQGQSHPRVYAVGNKSLRLKNHARRMILNYQTKGGQVPEDVIKQADNLPHITGPCRIKPTEADPELFTFLSQVYQTMEQEGWMKNPFVQSFVSALVQKTGREAHRAKRGESELDKVVKSMQ